MFYLFIRTHVLQLLPIYVLLCDYSSFFHLTIVFIYPVAKIFLFCLLVQHKIYLDRLLSRLAFYRRLFTQDLQWFNKLLLSILLILSILIFLFNFSIFNSKSIWSNLSSSISASWCILSLCPDTLIYKSHMNFRINIIFIRAFLLEPMQSSSL